MGHTFSTRKGLPLAYERDSLVWGSLFPLGRVQQEWLQGVVIRESLQQLLRSREPASQLFVHIPSEYIYILEVFDCDPTPVPVGEKWTYVCQFGLLWHSEKKTWGCSLQPQKERPNGIVLRHFLADFHCSVVEAVT